MGLLGRWRSRTERFVAASARQDATLLETLHAIASVKAYGQEPGRLRLWQASQAESLNESLGLARLRLVGDGVHTLLLGGQQIVLLTLAGREVLAGSLTLGMVMAFLSYQGQFSERFVQIFERLVVLRTLRVHLDRLADIALAPTEPDVDPGLVLPSRAPLHARGLAFGYDAAQRPLFADLQLCVEPGEFVAIVGSSGAGKSTLLKVMMGLLRPTAGELCYGSVRLGGAAVGAYRGLIGAVPQRDRLFAGSLQANLILDRALERSQLEALLSAFDLLDMVGRLPLGLATEVSELGGGFSGGELQRLFLVRALYRSPSLLFLDEATANLDTANAQRVIRLLSDLPMTRIAVTHDLALASRADRVLVLKDGVLAPRRIGAVRT
jgi:ATP-binding cassette subfamily B protein RaxB